MMASIVPDGEDSGDVVLECCLDGVEVTRDYLQKLMQKVPVPSSQHTGTQDTTPQGSISKIGYSKAHAAAVTKMAALCIVIASPRASLEHVV